MNLYIPEIGDRFKLESDWTFTLHSERRNTELFRELGLIESGLSWGEERKSMKDTKVTFKAGTILQVDRIYIRKGADLYSSITFYAEIGEGGTGNFGRPKHPRFWAKLSDCNKIEFSVEEFKTFRNIKIDTKMQTYKTNEWLSRWVFPGRMVESRFIDYTDQELDFDNEHTLNIIERGNIIYKFKIIGNVIIDSIPDEMDKGTFHLNKPKQEYSHKVKSVKYTLKTSDGEELGTWGTMTTLRKIAKEYILKNNIR